MSRNPIDSVNRMIFGKRFSELFQKWKREEKGRSETAFGELLDPPVRRGTVAKWRTGESLPNPYNTKQITKIFGVPEDYFNIDNATHDELYKLSSEYMTNLGRGPMTQFCYDIGLDLQFLYSIRELVGPDFDSIFPPWTEIIKNPNFMSEQTYIRRPVESWSESAEMAEDVRVLQYEIEINENGESKKKLLPFTYEDLRFLKEVQDNVIVYIEFLMMKRKKQMIKEVEKANRQSRFLKEDGGIAIRPLSIEELNQIDHYHDYHYHYSSKKDGE